MGAGEQGWFLTGILVKTNSRGSSGTCLPAADRDGMKRHTHVLNFDLVESKPTEKGHELT